MTGTPPSLVSPDIEEARERLQLYPGAVSVVGSDDYTKGRGAYLEDFLRYTPGIIIQSEQASEDTRASIRGSGIDADAIAGIELCIDGIPINQGDGEAYMLDLDLNTVKYAEVYRGADALQYGSIVLGGAINFITKTGQDSPGFTLKLSGGSWGFFEVNGSAGWSKGPEDIYASFTNHVLNGYQNWSQENDQKLFVSLGYRFPNAENRLYLFVGGLSQNNPTALTESELYADPRQTEPEAIQEKWNTYWVYERLLDRFVIHGDEWQLQLGLTWNHRQQTQSQEYDPDTPLGTQRYYSDDYGAVATFQTTADLFNHRNRFTIGIIPTAEYEHDAWYANTDGTIGPLLSFDKTWALNFPLFSEEQFWLTDKLSILTGFQAVYVQRKFIGSTSDDNLEFWAFNPKLALAFELTEKSKVYFNSSRTFQPPSFDEALSLNPNGGEVFNPLLPQSGWTIELGTKGEYGIASWDFAIYRSWLRDELQSLNNAEGVSIGTVNIAHSIHQGIEAGLQRDLSHGWKLVQTYTLNDFRFDNDPVYNNDAIAGIPRNFYRGELRYEHPSGFYAGANMQWNMSRYPVDMADTLYAKKYAIFGIRLGYQSKKGWELFAEVDNLANKIYAGSVQPIADARTAGGPPNVFNPGAGRSFYLGASWKMW